MTPGIQDFMRSAGEEACYALQIIHAAEEYLECHLDLMFNLEESVRVGYLYFNWKDPYDPANFRVDKGAEMLSAMTYDKWSLTHEAADYVAQPGEIVIDKWQYEPKGSPVTHFRSADFDTLIDSQTVKKGKIVGRRVFRRIP